MDNQAQELQILKPVSESDASRFNPEMLTLAREAAGITQSELARRLSVTQGTISKIEAGMHNVSTEILEGFCKILDQAPEFFYQNDKVYGLGVSAAFHRKRQTLPQKVLGKIHAEVNIRRIHIERLLRSAEIDSPRIPRMDVDEYDDDVEHIARVTREHMRLPRGPIQNMTQAIEEAGGIVIRCDFGTNQFDGVSFLGINDTPPLIFVNAASPGDRLRFTLAHELGHLVMHSTINPDIEEQADRFAAEFLMPESEIKSSLDRLDLGRLASLKQYWKASMASILYRASSLDVITERQKRYLWMQLGKAGYRTREPAELDIPVEKPSIMTELVQLHLDELGYSREEVSKLLALKVERFARDYLPQKGPQLKLVG